MQINKIYMLKKFCQTIYSTLFIVLLFLVSTGIFAQNSKVKNLKKFDKKRLHFGYTLGFNTMNFSIHKADNFHNTSELSEIYSIESVAKVGFQVGIISNLRLGEYFDLRLLLNVTLGQRDLEYNIIEDTISSNKYKYSSHKMQIASTFLSFPFHIKYRAKRISNYRPYLIAGINPKIDLASQKKIKEEEMPKIRLKRFDFYYEIGFGVDYYLPYFKLSTEIKFGAGLLNIIKGDNTQYTNSIDKMNSRMFMISFHFE